MPVTAVPIAEDLRARMVPLAFRVARLCSAAQVLSGLGRSLGQVHNDLFPPFEAARDAVRRFHAALGRGDDCDAASILSALGEDVERLKSLLCDVDALCSAEALDRWVLEEPTVSAEALARLVEFYAQDRPRDGASETKLVRVTRQLVARDECDAGEPDAVLAALQRRYLLQSASEAPVAAPPAGLASQYRALRKQIETLDAAEGLAAVEAECGKLRVELGEALWSPPGLALAVASEAWVERRREALARDQARPFASLLNDLEGVLELDTETTPPPPLEDDDPDALDSLTRAEQEMRASVANDTWAADGFFLDPEEAQTIQAVAQGQGGELEARVLACASCRMAVDRLARAHARSGQPDGQEPPPLPRPRALTYLREATRLENLLNDEIQQAVLRGEYALAKVATRTAHKLARSRLGLALLGDLPVTGRHERNDEPVADGGLGGNLEEDRLRRELEVAKIMRDALVGDGRSSQEGSAGASESGAGASGARATAALARASARAELTPQAIERRRRLRLLVAFAVVLVVTIAYHGSALLEEGARQLELNPREFSHSAPVQQVVPANGTFVVVASIDWETVGDARREEYVRLLWTDARQRGFHRMLVMNRAGDRPLAVASEGSVKVLPIEGDLRFHAEQQRAGR